MLVKSKIKNNLACTFNEFLNEANINPKGELEDFNFYDDPDVRKSEENDFIENTTNFFKENDAKDVKVEVYKELVRIKFDFYGTLYGVVGNLDTGYGELAELDPKIEHAKILGQFSDIGIFFDMIKDKGLYWIKDIE